MDIPSYNTNASAEHKVNKTNGLTTIRKENDRAFFNPLFSLHRDSNIHQLQFTTN